MGMIPVGKKFFWKRLAPRPYSSLWLWIASRSVKPQSPDYWIPRGSRFIDGDGDIVVDDDDDDYTDDEDDTHGPLGNGFDGDDNGTEDWLDSTLASLDQSILDFSDCVVQSIPVTNQPQSQSIVKVDQQSDSIGLKVARIKSKDNNRRKTNKDTNSARISEESVPEVDESPRKKVPTVREFVTEEIDQIGEDSMKILEISDSHTILVLKKSPNKQFSIVNGEAKITVLVGSIVCDGYKLGMDQSAHISTGFGTYQITIEPVKFQSYPSKEHLLEVLDYSTITVPETVCLSILEYLSYRSAGLAECIIISFQKWRWPALTALRMLVQPEVTFPHWLQVSFANVKSPVVQWSSMLTRLYQELKNRVESASSKPLTRSTTRGPRVIMLGGVNAGKSSLSRHICNQIVSSIADTAFVVDCDPGQSEFSPPGIINIIRVRDPILSPPFINCLRFNKHILMSCSVAGTSLSTNPDLYILSVKHLWQTFLETLSDEDSCKPVIINTIGWTQGLGAHLMVDILHIFKPTFVIEIKRQPWQGKDNFSFDCNPDTINQLNGWLVEPQRVSLIDTKPSSECSLKPYLNYDYIRISNHFYTKKCSSDSRRNRTNNQLAYFCLMEEILFKNVFDLEVITLDLENLYFHVQHEFVIDKHLIPYVIKDSWIHLCSIDHQESENQSSDNMISQPSTSSSSSSATTATINPITSSVPPGFTEADAKSSICWESTTINVNLKILPFLRVNKCIGSAIVKDIDTFNNKLIILTPEPYDRISQVNCIVRPQGIYVPEQLQSRNTTVGGINDPSTVDQKKLFNPSINATNE